MMKLLPSESFAIETTTDIRELIGLLRATTRPAPLGVEDPPILPLSLHDTLFVGDVTNEGFELRRDTKYWNWAPPHLFGAFRRSAIGTVINVDVRLTRARRVGFSVMGLAITLASLGLLISGEMEWIVLAWPATFLGVVYAGTWFSVRAERSEGRRALEAICGVPN